MAPLSVAPWLAYLSLGFGRSAQGLADINPNFAEPVQPSPKPAHHLLDGCPDLAELASRLLASASELVAPSPHLIELASSSVELTFT